MSKKIDFTKELAALTSDEFTASVPYHATVGEAADIAVFVRKQYKGDKKAGTPGLEDAGISLAIVDEIGALIEHVLGAQAAYRQKTDPKVDTTKLDRARYLIDEIGATLEFFLDDGVEDENDQRFAKLVAAHKNAPDSPDALAVELDEYASVADMHTKEIDGLGGFDAKLIDEAHTLARELLAIGPRPPVSPEATAALHTRNRYLQLLDRRVRRVRAAARFVFRKHPEVVRAAVSLYERKRRVDAKRAATLKKKTEPAATPEA